MKIALCVSGQPRNLEECYPFIKEAVMQDHDIDVFSHIWWDESYQGKTYMWHSTARFENKNLADIFLDLYKPVSYKIEKQKEFDLSFCKMHNYGLVDSSTPEKSSQIMTPGSLFCVMSQTYSILQADLLRQSFDKEYDLVIRIRTDLYFKASIDFSSVMEVLRNNPNEILWQNSMSGGPEYTGLWPNNPCDYFCIATPETMTKVTNFWHSSIQKHYSNGVIHINEYVRKFCEDAGVSIGLANFSSYVLRNADSSGNAPEFREMVNYHDDFDGKTGDIKSRKAERPYFADFINFKKLLKVDKS